MNELLAKLMRLKVQLKAGVTAIAVVIMGGLYYVLFYMDLGDQINGAKGQQATLQAEKESYEKRRREYIAYRDELRKLQEEQREILKALPKKAEIPTFMSNIQEQADLAGLETLSFAMEAEVSEQDLYVKIPVRMEVRGTYHSLAKFFKNIAELRRIVNVEDLSLTNEGTTDPTPTHKLRARFVAATFRYAGVGS